MIIAERHIVICHSETSELKYFIPMDCIAIANMAKIMMHTANNLRLFRGGVDKVFEPGTKELRVLSMSHVEAAK